jgi:hypothetical protein
LSRWSQRHRFVGSVAVIAVVALALLPLSHLFRRPHHVGVFAGIALASLL